MWHADHEAGLQALQGLHHCLQQLELCNEPPNDIVRACTAKARLSTNCCARITTTLQLPQTPALQHYIDGTANNHPPLGIAETLAKHQQCLSTLQQRFAEHTERIDTLDRLLLEVRTAASLATCPPAHQAFSTDPALPDMLLMALTVAASIRCEAMLKVCLHDTVPTHVDPMHCITYCMHSKRCLILCMTLVQQWSTHTPFCGSCSHGVTWQWRQACWNASMHTPAQTVADPYVDYLTIDHC